MKDSCCSPKKQYPQHNKQIPRLNRIAGQIEGIKKMIASGRYCNDILMQLSAVKCAIRRVETDILERHLDSCVIQAFNSEKEKQQKINEVLNLFKKM